MVEIRPSKLSESEILRILQEAGLGAVPNTVTHGESDARPSQMKPSPISFVELPKSRAPTVDLEPRGNDSYRLEEMLAFHDASFVATAYRVLLKRSPDAGGFIHYLGLLRDGVSKVEILGRLRYSAEGKLRRVRLEGLARAMARIMIYRIPILGYAAEVLLAVFSLPTVIRNIRRFESFSVLSDESLREDLNALAEIGNRNFNNINSRR